MLGDREEFSESDEESDEEGGDAGYTLLPTPYTLHPQSGIKSSFSIALICTARCRTPASASTNQGSEEDNLVLL